MSDRQKEQLAMLGALYRDWNEKINVISRKDVDNLYERHVLHSLAIASFLGDVVDETSFVDVGTGGGFPAIPLAVMYPRCRFRLVDRIAKKLRVAEDIGRRIGLENISPQHGDMGECHDAFGYALSRAAMPLNTLVKVVRKNIAAANRNIHPNGLICLKGGDIANESAGITFPIIEFPVSEYFNEPFFETKKLIYVPMRIKK